MRHKFRVKSYIDQNVYITAHTWPEHAYIRNVYESIPPPGGFYWGQKKTVVIDGKEYGFDEYGQGVSKSCQPIAMKAN